MTLSDITFKRDNHIFRNYYKFEDVFVEVVIKKEKEAQCHIDMKKQKKILPKKDLLNLKEKVALCLKMWMNPKEMTSLKGKLEKKRRNKSRSSKKMFNQQMKFQKS